MKTALAVGLLALTGCTHPDVHHMANGQHWLSAVAPSGGFAGSREEGVERANAYCMKSGQQAVIDGFYDKSAMGPLGEHISSVIFTCAAPRPLHF
jgi:hypothetical protein